MDITAQVRESVEQQVRASIRNDSLDPMAQPERFRALVTQVTAEAWMRHGGDGDHPEAADIARRVHDSIAGFGALQQFFDDPSVEEIWINAPGRVFIARHGLSELTTVMLTATEVRNLVERMLRVSGRRLDLASPFVDAMLPDGSRLHVVIPEVTRVHWSVNIRRFVVRPQRVVDLVQLGTLTADAAAFLHAAVASGLNILIAGSTQAGKTTLLNALLGSVAASERVITCEEVFEIQTSHPDWVAMQTRDASLEGAGAIPLRRLVREALRMRPTRLIVGEVRQAEALDLLIAMNSGMPAMATLHANSAREAISKLCTLPLLAGANIPGDFVVPTVAGCIDLVIHVETRADGSRSTAAIAGVSGRVEHGVIEIADLYTDAGQGLVRGSGFPPHPDRFRRAGFDLAHLLGAGGVHDPGRAA